MRKKSFFLFKCFLQNHQISVFKPPHIQCKPVSGPQAYQKPPQTIIHGVDEGDQR